MKTKAANVTVVLIVLVIGYILANLPAVLAVPTGANVSVVSTETAGGKLDSGDGAQITAEAGNVTEIFINSTRVTTRWQGYYGNISGKIVLDDAYNYSMYDWEITNPTGEIYAANYSTITWADIKCFNLTSNLTDGWTMNVTTLETMIGAGANDIDGVNETFNSIYSDSTGFNVGSVTINDEDGCPLAYTYVSDASQATDYKEVILTDNTSVIWTTIIEADGTTGYDGNAWDFQMIVGENGDNSDATNYYFYVEIA